MEIKTNNRIEYIDALRGMTMILVVYSHVAYWCFNNSHLAYNDIFICFRMPTFFFISGWVFYKIGRTWDKSTICTILKKKFMVQIIPFLVFMLLFVNLFKGPDYPYSFEDKYGYWFTFSLFEFFVIYIVAEFLLNKQAKNKKEIIVLFLMLLLSITAFFYEQVKFNVHLGIWKPVLTLFSFSKIKYLFFFWLGTFVKKNFASFIRLTDNQYLIAACLCLFLILLWGPDIKTNYITFLLSGISGTIILFTFFRKHEAIFSKTNRFGLTLQYIGQRTLDIYLIHYFVLPYHMNYFATWLSQYSHKTIDMLIILIISFWIVFISLLISNIFRLSPFLSHYLFGVNRAAKPDKVTT